TGLERPPVPVEPPPAPAQTDGVNPSGTSAPVISAPPYTYRESDINQDAIFRSTDQGATWEMLKDGFMAEANSTGWSINPVFASEQEVWTWGRAPDNDEAGVSIWGTPVPKPTRKAADGTELVQTSLFFSSDQGKTATHIYSPEPFFAPSAYLHQLLDQPNTPIDLSNRDNSDAERYIVPIDDTHAYAWVSENIRYHIAEDYHQLHLSTHITLNRTSTDDEWQVNHITREQGVQITHATTSADGRTYATLSDENGEWLARLDKETGEWVERHPLPALLPDWLVKNRMSARYFQNNGDYQV